MKRHFTSTHDPICKHVCNICGQRFALHQYLQEHSSTHTGEKLFKCHYKLCNAAFTQAGKLSAHKKLHYIKSVQSHEGEIEHPRRLKEQLLRSERSLASVFKIITHR